MEEQDLPGALIEEEKAVVSLRTFSFDYAVPTGYHNLPISVLIKIFSHFSQRELQETIIPVCAHWRYAAMKPELWTFLRVSRNDVPLTFLFDRLRKLTGIETLYLENLNDPNPLLVQAGRCLRQLKHLSVRGCTSLRSSSLYFLITKFPGLESLDLTRSELESFSIFSRLGNLIKLRSVNLSAIPNINIPHIIGAVINAHYLEELKISAIITPKVYLNDEDAILLINKLSYRLKVLSIDCCTLTNTFFHAICDCIQLEQLGLYSANNLTGDTLHTLGESLENLKQLKLRHAHHISSADIEGLFTKSHKNLKNLHVLDLTGCWKVSDAALTKIVQVCTELTALSLKGCKKIRGFHLLGRLSKLIYLNLSFCTSLCNCSTITLPATLNVLVTHDEANLGDLFKRLLSYNKKLKIYISASEYNQSLRLYNNIKVNKIK